MLNSRISLHMALMFLLAGLHLLLILLVGYQIGVIKTMESTKCGSLHMATRLLYLSLNLVMLLYVFNLARKAKIQSMDIYIFDLQIRIVKILMPVVCTLCVCYLLTNHMCVTNKFPEIHFLLYFSHLMVELLALWAYFTWYQAELKRYCGAEDTPADNQPASTTFSK